MVYKSLVIGCGNIGALYDWDSDNILTHAKAMHLDHRFSLAVYDVNLDLAKKVSNKYNCEAVKNINESILHSFDCINICTPTDTHYGFLKQALNAKVKLIICEKPVSNNVKELNSAKSLYRKGEVKILVNYIRRFQPAYLHLKRHILNILRKETLTNITIRYQKGFINNCSHAFDTIEYLTDDAFTLKNIKVHNKLTDHFADDPTLSLQAMWNKANVTITGLSNVKFNFFEIDLYFEYHWVAIKNSGASVQIYKAGKRAKGFQPLKNEGLFSRENCLKDYMKYVIGHAYDLLSAKVKPDNFSNSIDLNLRMLNYMNN